MKEQLAFDFDFIYGNKLNSPVVSAKINGEPIEFEVAKYTPLAVQAAEQSQPLDYDFDWSIDFNLHNTDYHFGGYTCSSYKAALCQVRELFK